MIADFIQEKKKLYQILNIYLRAEVKNKMPFFRNIGRHFMHEGNKSSYETVDHQRKNLDFQKAESSFTMTKDEMSKARFADIFFKIQQTALSMASQIEGSTFKTLTKIIEEDGNIIPGNPAFSADALLKALENIEMDFDDTRDKPHMPTLIMHPNLAQKVIEDEKKITTEEKNKFAEKQKEILDKKYQQYVDRESKRKIID